jgi:hypothetical protein
MLTVRVAFAGVMVASLSFVTRPAGACDDRYLKKCERAARVQAELPAQPLAASCTAGFSFCDNCARTINVTTRKDIPCMMRYAVSNGAILSQQVTKRGSGIYGTANPTTGAYQPPPGYVGKDYFEIEVSYERLGTKLKTTLKANVTITN